MKLGVISLGCDKATVDSERLVGKLVGCGARLERDISQADVVLINTCGFIDAAKQESIETILEIAELTKTGKIKAVAAVGCLVQRYKDELKREIPEIDFFMGFADLPNLVPSLRSQGLLPAESVTDHPGVRQYLGTGAHVRYLKISEGCDHGCAFCAIPLMRGSHTSEPINRLVAEAQTLEAQGAKEISLVAQDLGHYGRDLGRDGPKLPDLLQALLAEPTIPWFRLLYVYLFGLTDRLIDLIASEPRITPYIDIPIQHASGRVLEKMRRPERQATIRDKVRWLRDAVPDMAIRSTAIVGFPSEGEDDFQVLCDFVQEIEFERLGVFTYSEQEGTRAAQYADDVPSDVKRCRQEELLELQRCISEDRLARFVGRETDVLIDEICDPDDDGSTHVGRVVWQADDVDGVTRVEKGGWAQPGEFLTVRITSNRDCDFSAIALK